MSLLTSVLKEIIGSNRAEDSGLEKAPTSAPIASGLPTADTIGVPFQLRSDVIFLSGFGQNDAISGLLHEYELLFRSHGMSVHFFNLSDPAFDYATILDLLNNGHVALVLTYLGIGCDLSISINGDQESRENIWEFFGTPVLKLNGDIPAYFSERHSPLPRTSVNIYYALEFHHYAERWIAGRDHGMLNVVRPPFPISCVSPAQVDISARRAGKLVFLKNGNCPAKLVEHWRSALSPAIFRTLIEMVDELREPCLGSSIVFLDDLVLNSLNARGYSKNVPPRLVHFFVAQLDDYFRRLKSLMIAEAVLDFPVIVQGNNWDHVNFHNRKATYIAGATYADSLEIYRSQLGVIDMSPNISSAPHDRVTRSAGNYSLCITNRQQWLIEHFSGFEDLTFEFTLESIGERVNDVLKRPDDYLDLAAAFGARFREIWSGERVFSKLIESAEVASLLHGRAKPKLQPYFVW